MDKRQGTKELIVERSREVFLDKGIFNTAMNDIATSVGLTRRTIYRYFKSIEDLAYETTIEILNEWNIYQRDIFNKLEGNGVQRLEIFLNSLIDYMNKRTDIMRYLGEFDFYFKDGTTSKANTDTIQRFNEIILESDELLSEIMILGKGDRSIKEELDVKLMVTTISNVLWSFGQKIAIRGEMIKEESGLDGITLIKNQVNLYIIAIKEARNENNKIT